jgi:hypothetical protein
MNSDKPKIEGLGDIIQRLTKAVKIPTCSKCEERRKKLNKMFSFSKDQTPTKEPDPSKPDPSRGL